MRLGTQDRDFFPKNIEEKLRFVKNMGFECFEIDGKLLMDNAQEVKKAVEKTGLPISSACGGYRGWIGDFIEERRRNGVEDLKQILRLLGEVGGSGVVIPAAWGMFTFRLPPMVSPRSREGDREAILTSLAALDPVAGENGVKLYLEPLNRYQDHMLNTQEECKEIIEAGGFKHVKTTYDFYHMAIEEDSLAGSIVKYKDQIGHVHIAENHRYQPGSGAIDWDSAMAALKQIGYEGDVVNEGRIRGEDPLAAYQQSVDFMKKYF